MSWTTGRYMQRDPDADCRGGWLRVVNPAGKHRRKQAGVRWTTEQRASGHGDRLCSASPLFSELGWVSRRCAGLPHARLSRGTTTAVAGTAQTTRQVMTTAAAATVLTIRQGTTMAARAAETARTIRPVMTVVVVEAVTAVVGEAATANSRS